MDIDLSQFNSEILAGYISPDFVVYSFAPDYIQKMAKEINKEFKNFNKSEFFKFEKSEDIFGNNPPKEIIKIRKELELEYTK